MKRLLILSLFLFSAFPLLSQTKKEKAKSLMNTAITEMDNGKTAKAISLLNEAKKLDPDDITYDYEIAFAYNIDKNYKKVIKICEKLTKHKDVFKEVYQMLGNAYDYSGKSNEAIKAYERGMKVFPNAGNLYLERGNMDLVKEKYDAALAFYLKGIDVDPMYPSNYYWCARIYLSSENEYLGMIYGELFVNLERNSKRTIEMSELLFATYKNEIVFSGDTSVSVSFASNTIHLSENELNDQNSADKLLQQLTKTNFGLSVYEMDLSLAVIGESKINLASLNRIRANFLENYYANNHHVKYPNVLFAFQKNIEEEGYLEAYNYWILSQGSPDEFKRWTKANPSEWDAFIEWFNPNPISIDQGNKFILTSGI